MPAQLTRKQYAPNVREGPDRVGAEDPIVRMMKMPVRVFRPVRMMVIVRVRPRPHDPKCLSNHVVESARFRSSWRKTLASRSVGWIGEMLSAA